jgi:hypothetical protein
LHSLSHISKQKKEQYEISIEYQEILYSLLGKEFFIAVHTEYEFYSIYLLFDGEFGDFAAGVLSV